MSIAFMAMFSLFLVDRIHARLGVVVMLPLMSGLGVGSVIYGHFSEAAGLGDLRFYYLLNPVYPALALPLICLLFAGRITRGWYLLYVYLAYGAALACERFDDKIFNLLGETVSGHTIKHILAAVAIYFVLAMLRQPASKSSLAEPGRQVRI